MSTKNFKILLVIFLVTGSLYFIFIGLTSGKGFLIPIVTAMILAMVMAPIAARFRKWGLKKGWAVFLADLIVVAFIAFMVFLLAAQSNQIANNWSEIESRLKPKVEQANNYFHNRLNLSSPLGGQQQNLNNQQQDQERQEEQQNQNQNDSVQQQQNSEQQLQQNQDKEQKQQEDSLQEQGTPTGEKQQIGSNNQDSSAASFDPQIIQSHLSGIVKNAFSFISNLLLVLIYIFFFLYYSNKFRNTITGMVKEEKRKKTEKILDKISKTAQQYLLGRFILIFILAVLYMIGWSILGLKYALFISVIAALFSLIPYVGNLIGLFLALAMSFLSGDNGGSAGQIIAIFAVFGIVQFLESYILEPFVVGKQVDLNPVVIIVGVVLGGMIWGVMGMILSIPILGIIRVVFDNIESLRPLGYALDERDVGSEEGKQDKIKEWLMNKAKKTGIKKS